MRFSIEWSRVFPTATDAADGYDALKKLADPAALAHYHAELAALKQRGIKPLVTLNHYTLPTWIHDAAGCHVDLASCAPRGWLDKDRTVKEIAKYAGFVAKEFGAEIDLWATLNEPFAVMLPGYVFPSASRSNPPAVLLKFTEAKTVLVGLIEAHARMYDAIKANDTADADGDGKASEVGVVYAMAPVKADDPTFQQDVTAAENVFYLWNMVYLNAVAKGDLDAELTGQAVHRDDLANRMDYLGINYYTRITVQGTATPQLPELSPLSTFNPFTIKQWEDYPKGIYEMAMVVKDQLKLPAIVTENGAADPDDDGTAPSYMVRHLTWLSRAIHDGADVRGYFYWTLMDNYEWNHGMDIRMGLYAVDKSDPQKTRKPRRAVEVFSRIAEGHAVPADLAKSYPVE
jgi:beta-glucosidase/6-phospho-beta-glucosidase/beta-galactosidase